jgi:hypothetical protein
MRREGGGGYIHERGGHISVQSTYSLTGNELYLSKLEEYLLYPDEEVCFWDLHVRGERRQEV